MAEAKITFTWLGDAVVAADRIREDTEHEVTAASRGRILTITCTDMGDLFCTIKRLCPPTAGYITKAVIREERL
jgi:hypothetical protein